MSCFFKNLDRQDPKKKNVLVSLSLSLSVYTWQIGNAGLGLVPHVLVWCFIWGFKMTSSCIWVNTVCIMSKTSSGATVSILNFTQTLLALNPGSHRSRVITIYKMRAELQKYLFNTMCRQDSNSTALSYIISSDHTVNPCPRLGFGSWRINNIR